MAQRKTKRPAKKPARKPPKKASRKVSPRRPGKKEAAAPELPPLKIDAALHESMVNFLGGQKLSDIVGLWNNLRQCKPRGNVVVIPGLYALQLVQYIEQTQPVVQLYLQLRSVTPVPAGDPPDEPSANKASNKAPS